MYICDAINASHVLILADDPKAVSGLCRRLKDLTKSLSDQPDVLDIVSKQPFARSGAD